MGRSLKRPHLAYVISDGTEWVKLGVTTNMPRRVLALQNGSRLPLKVIASLPVNGANPLWVERAAHAELAGCERRGEWFRVSTERAVEAITLAINLSRSAGKHSPAPPLMSTEQYRFAIQRLGFSHSGAGPKVGLSRRQAQYIYAGDCPVPDVVAKLLMFMLKYGPDVPPLDIE